MNIGMWNAPDGMAMDIIHVFADATAPPPEEWLRSEAAKAPALLVTLEPWQWPTDAMLHAWGESLSSMNRTVYIRFMHEANGTWYPWATASAGSQFSGWQRFADSMHQYPGLKTVWSPNVIYDQRRFGNSVADPRTVDVVALDGYNWNDPRYGGWKNPRDLFHESVVAIRQQYPARPLWLAETGCAASSGRVRWLRDLMTYAASAGIGAVIYFNENKEGETWRLQGPTEYRALFGGHGKGRKKR